MYKLVSNVTASHSPHFPCTGLLPTISVSPNPVTANRPASFSCIFQNSTAPDTVTFFRGGDPVDFGSVTISSTSAELTIPSFTSRLDGSYECRISVGAETAVSRVIRVSAGKHCMYMPVCTCLCVLCLGGFEWLAC